VALDFDAKFTGLASEILREAVQAYDSGETERLLIGFNPGLSGIGGGAATGSFPVLTGSFAAATGSFPAATGSFTEILTGAFKALGQEPMAESPIPLKQVFRLPRRLPGVRLPAEPSLGAMARSARMMVALDALARWLGRDGRLVTPSDELTAADARDACGQLHIAPAYLPYLWEYALTAGWFELVDSPDGSRAWAVVGRTAWRWAEGDDSGALHTWAVLFAAVAARALDVAAMADVGASRRLSFQGQGVVLAIMLFLARRDGLTMRDLRDLVREGAIGERPPGRVRRAWDGWVRAYGDPAQLLLDELDELGAVSLPRAADGPVVLTPLGSWALREQFRHEGITVPVLGAPSPQMSAAELVTLAESGSDGELDAVFADWVGGRGPDRAARELLLYAASSGPHGRLAAIGLVRRIGVSARRAWRDAIRRPELRGYAWITLSMMADRLPASTLPLVLEPDPDDLIVMASDLLALAGDADEADSEEIASWFAAAVPEGEQAWILGLMGQSSDLVVARFLDLLSMYHPDAEIARDACRAARASARKRRMKTVRPGRAPALERGR
jgi:hypothetical protein